MWKISAPQRTASANDGAPSGITMNSWKSTLLSACAPPFRMFIIGTGSTRAAGRAVERREMRVERHAVRRRRCARASAIDTPSSALAPSRPLFGVPSSSIMDVSIAR